MRRAIAVLVAVLVVAGCGGRSSEEKVNDCSAALKAQIDRIAAQVYSGQEAETPSTPDECKGLSDQEQTQAANKALQDEGN